MEIINHKGKHYLKTKTGYKEILASTDKSLGKEVWKQTNKKSKSYNIQQNIETTKKVFISLPQPSQSFIEKFIEEYNKGNVITEVMVEYWDIDDYSNAPIGQTIHSLKVNPKDNTITICKVKDSWTREEIERKLYQAMSEAVEFHQQGSPNYEVLITNWIEENL